LHFFAKLSKKLVRFQDVWTRKGRQGEGKRKADQVVLVSSSRSVAFVVCCAKARVGARVMEYLAAEVLEIAGNAARDNKTHLRLVIRNYE